MVGLALGQRAIALGFQQLGIAEDRRQRRAQLIAHIAHELGLQPVCRLKRLGPVAQRRFHPPRRRHIGKGDHRVSIGQRMGEVGQQRAIRAAHFAGGGLARRRVGDVNLDAFPDVHVMEQRHAAAHHIIIVRLVLQPVRRNIPHPLKRAVVQLQPTVRAKHGDRFVQIVQRGGLRLDQRIEARLQRQVVRDILEQNQQPAHRVALARDRQCAAVGERPLVFLHPVNIEIIGNLLGAPFGIVRPCREFLLLAQPVQQLAMIGTVQKERLFQVPHVTEGLVVEIELPVRPEDRHGVGHMVQRLVMRADVPVELLAGVLLLGHVKRHTPCPARQREGQHTHCPALVVDHDMAGLVMLGPVGDRLAGLLVHRLVQHQLALQHAVEIAAIDRFDIGGVGPLQASHAGNAPGRERRLAQHVEKRRRVARNHLPRLFQLAAGRAFLQPLDRRVIDPDHRAHARRAPIRLQEAAGRPDDRQREGLPALAQLPQADAQRRVLPRRIARFQIRQPLNDAHRRVWRNRVISKAEQPGQRHRRAIKLRRGDLVPVQFQRVALPDENDARMGA